MFKLDPKSFGCGLMVGAVLTLVLAFAVLLAFVGYDESHGNLAAPSAEDRIPRTGDEALTQLLQPIRQQHRMPAIAGAIVTSRNIARMGAVGVRKRGTEVAVTLDDLWHLGSNTKAMTSALAARLIERNLLRWDSTVAEVFSEWASSIHPEMKPVTLLHLLTHRAGLPANLAWRDYLGDNVVALRLRAAKTELAKRPRHAPGSRYEYSNLGYVIAGAMMETAAGKSWEESMREEIFVPLGMGSAGFGGTGTPGQPDQPWGHFQNGKPVPRNGPDVDNPPIMGPAGRVHCTLQDWAKFVADQLRGAQGKPALLRASSYEVLHTPPFGGDYSPGWLVTQRGWGGGTVFHHAGDNTMNFANVWMAPGRDVAFLICINHSGNDAFEASDEAVAALLGLHEKDTHEQ